MSARGGLHILLIIRSAHFSINQSKYSPMLSKHGRAQCPLLIAPYVVSDRYGSIVLVTGFQKSFAPSIFPSELFHALSGNIGRHGAELSNT